MDDISSYLTAGGITVRRTATTAGPEELATLTTRLDGRRGGVLSSGVEYPGRYSRWHVGYLDPPLELVAYGRRVRLTALNERGRLLLPALVAAVAPVGDLRRESDHVVEVSVPPGAPDFPEEERTRRPTVFSVLRAILTLFASPEDEHLGLYGAYGYDLAFQFEPLRLRHERPGSLRDLVLHVPDELIVFDRKRETCVRYSYEFTADGHATDGLPRVTPPTPAPDVRPLPAPPVPGAFADVVRAAREKFRRGDLFEVTPSHLMYGACSSPAEYYERLRAHNPAPYEFLFNLGEGEYLVGASPEMYVRVGRTRSATPGIPAGTHSATPGTPAGTHSATPGTPAGLRVETCPIAGTIRRGRDALEDAGQIRALLNSGKDEAELTMCTDVDRNDKARVCEAGSVRVIGRRQIELYRRLIHTVDHVEGELRPGFDAFDAFLTHMWAVTVTGAPKQWAMQFIEDHESSPRRWYGAAVGFAGFDGSMNTGLTLRTAHIQDGVATVRAGATLLYDSDPEEEERETHLKAQALLDVISSPPAPALNATAPATTGPEPTETLPGRGMRVLVVDHQDSFVHTLGDYFRQLGAGVTTRRFGFDPSLLDDPAPDLVVLSPGPGRPDDFGCAELLAALDARGLPVFGVCLGLQAMVEAEGGELGVLPAPAHGKPGRVVVRGGELLAGVGPVVTAGRYHSLYAKPEQVKGYQVTAVAEDSSGETVAMAIEDPVRRRYAVQFHPESILTAAGRAGHQVVANVLSLCARDRSRSTG